MDQPIFPQEFVRNHCRKVLEARTWRKLYQVEGTIEDDMNFAECAFFRAGSGMECESCRLFLTRPFTHHEVDRKYLPQIEDFYVQLAIYEEEKAKEETIYVNLGSGI